MPSRCFEPRGCRRKSNGRRVVGVRASASARARNQGRGLFGSHPSRESVERPSSPLRGLRASVRAPPGRAPGSGPAGDYPLRGLRASVRAPPPFPRGDGLGVASGPHPTRPRRSCYLLSGAGPVRARNAFRPVEPVLGGLCVLASGREKSIGRGSSREDAMARSSGDRDLARGMRWVPGGKGRRVAGCRGVPATARRLKMGARCPKTTARCAATTA